MTPETPLATDAELMERRWRRERAARLESEQIAEAGLRRLWDATAELDRRVAERTGQLQFEHDRAEAADAAKTAFLANLGHEVRTPLQTVLATLELVRPSDAADASRVEMATEATQKLRTLFDNLLELAQIEVGSVEIDPVPTDLDAVADDLVDRWAHRLRARGLLLVPDSGGSAVLDPCRLAQIGDALLSNAEKFATPGTVHLRLLAHPERVELQVEDEGPGVDRRSLHRIFEPFVQLEGGNDRTVGGSGVGLAIVAGLATCMGGHAGASTTNHGGLVVTAAVPLEPIHVPVSGLPNSMVTS